MAVFVATAALLEGDFGDRRLGVVPSALLAPVALEEWSALLLEHVKPAEDPTHEGVFSPGPRDDAKDFRYRCLSALAHNPSIDARDALRRLMAVPAMQAYLVELGRLLETQESVAAEVTAAPWTEEAVLAVEKGDERSPLTTAELFEMVRAHLVDVAALMETDEFTYRELFSAESDERLIQRWVASTLRQRAGRLYVVVRENEVGDEKEVDITAAAQGVGQVPVEIKPTMDYYSIADLEKTITEQLIGKYMAQPDRTHGILLLVRHRDKTWGKSVERKGFDDVVAHLTTFAQAEAAKRGKVIAVAAVDILGSRGAAASGSPKTVRKATRRKKKEPSSPAAE